MTLLSGQIEHQHFSTRAILACHALTAIKQERIPCGQYMPVDGELPTRQMSITTTLTIKR
jgi:hypothetical protein